MADQLKNFEPGHEYSVNGEVTSANLQKLISNAAPLSTLVSQRDSLESPADPSLVEVMVRDGNQTGGNETKMYKASSVDWLNLKETVGTPNISLGENSGGLSTTGSLNLFVGNQAGRYTGEGANNTALGHKALKSDSGATLTRNTAVGTGAMETLNDHTRDNVAIGNNALYGVGPDGVTHSSKQAVNNVAIGSDAGLGLYGEDNVAIGGAALREGDTSSENVAVGNEALKNSKTGSENVAIGSEALSGSDALTQNVGVGNSTLTHASDTSENTAIGYKSGQLTQSNRNVLVGVEAGRLIQGAGNTVVGYKAMSSSADISYVNCVVLGANASPTRNNQVVLGDPNVTHVKLPVLPTSDAGLAQGELYTDNGVVKQKQ